MNSDANHLDIENKIKERIILKEDTAVSERNSDQVNTQNDSESDIEDDAVEVTENEDSSTWIRMTETRASHYSKFNAKPVTTVILDTIDISDEETNEQFEFSRKEVFTSTALLQAEDDDEESFNDAEEITDHTAEVHGSEEKFIANANVTHNVGVWNLLSKMRGDRNHEELSSKSGEFGIIDHLVKQVVVNCVSKDNVLLEDDIVNTCKEEFYQRDEPVNEWNTSAEVNNNVILFREERIDTFFVAPFLEKSNECEYLLGDTIFREPNPTCKSSSIILEIIEEILQIVNKADCKSKHQVVLTVVICLYYPENDIELLLVLARSSLLQILHCHVHIL